MNLPEDTIELLRDDAYLMLCREAVLGALEHAAAEKKQVASTRPPFGVLATKKARETFEHSMHMAHTTESALQARLAKLDQLETPLQTKLRIALHQYLTTIAPDYRLRPEVLAAIDSWEAQLRYYHEQLRAFARELSTSANVVAHTPSSSPEGFHQRMEAFAGLHVAATGVDSAATKLELSAQKLASLVGTLFAPIRVGDLPFVKQTQWVDRITRLLDPEIIAATNRAETTVREELAGDLSSLYARAAAAREQVDFLAANYLDTYAQQLRTHAIAHYVEERDVEEVIAMLTERYITAELQRNRQRLAVASNIYQDER